VLRHAVLCCCAVICGPLAGWCPAAPAACQLACLRAPLAACCREHVQHVWRAARRQWLMIRTQILNIYVFHDG
jgi:hypothetical protein